MRRREKKSRGYGGRDGEGEVGRRGRRREVGGRRRRLRGDLERYPDAVLGFPCVH